MAMGGTFQDGFIGSAIGAGVSSAMGAIPGLGVLEGPGVAKVIGRTAVASISGGVAARSGFLWSRHAQPPLLAPFQGALLISVIVLPRGSGGSRSPSLASPPAFLFRASGSARCIWQHGRAPNQSAFLGGGKALPKCRIHRMPKPDELQALKQCELTAGLLKQAVSGEKLAKIGDGLKPVAALGDCWERTSRWRAGGRVSPRSRGGGGRFRSRRRRSWRGWRWPGGAGLLRAG